MMGYDGFNLIESTDSDYFEMYQKSRSPPGLTVAIQRSKDSDIPSYHLQFGIPLQGAKNGCSYEIEPQDSAKGLFPDDSLTDLLEKIGKDSVRVSFLEGPEITNKIVKVEYTVDFLKEGKSEAQVIALVAIEISNSVRDYIAQHNKI